MSSAAQAKRAANVGAEAWFDIAHTRYRAQRRAIIARCHFPVRGAPGKMYPIDGGDADFVGLATLADPISRVTNPLGVVQSRTVAVAFDLKVNRHASYKIDVRPKSLGGTPEVLRQVQLLLDFWRTGGVGFLALLDPSAGELWMLGERPLTWLLEHPNQFLKYRARVGEVWEAELQPGVVCVRESSDRTVATTGIRYDWLGALPALVAAQTPAVSPQRPETGT